MKNAGSHTQITSLSTVQTITVPEGNPPNLYMAAHDQNVHFTTDGTAPTTTKGFVVGAGTTIVVEAPTSGQIKVIEASASAKLDYQFFYP